MSLPGATQQVNHIRSVLGLRDEYGNKSELFEAVATYRANLFVTTRRELVDGILTEVKEHRCLLPPEAAGTVKRGDVIEGENGVPLRVQNSITRRDHTGRIHHETVDLTESP